MSKNQNQETVNNGAATVIDGKFKEVDQNQGQPTQATANTEQPKPADTKPAEQPKEGFFRKLWKGFKKALPFIGAGAVGALAGTWFGKTFLGVKAEDVVDAVATVVQDAPAALVDNGQKAIETAAETAQDVVQSLTE